MSYTGYDGNGYSPAAVLKIGPDKYTSAIGTGVMPGRILFLTYDETGTTGADNAMVFNRQGRLGIGKDDPDEKLDVVGNITASGFVQPGVYADPTARDADITSPAAGMIVFVTSLTQFQGYDGTSWVALN